MEFTQLFGDDDAVSPVIGVILMVAITVILAAVIGTFVLGLGDQVSNTSPTASFTFDYTEGGSTPSNACVLGSGSSGDFLEITHDGGDQITAGQLTVKDDSGNSSPFDGCDSSLSDTSDVSAGTTVIADEVGSGATVRITWESSNGDDTSTLGKWTGPDA